MTSGRRAWEQVVTPDSAQEDALVSRVTVEQICQLLGHDPTEVLGVLMFPDRIDVMTTGGPDRTRTTVLHRHRVL